MEGPLAKAGEHVEAEGVGGGEDGAEVGAEEAGSVGVGAGDGGKWEVAWGGVKNGGLGSSRLGAGSTHHHSLP